MDDQAGKRRRAFQQLFEDAMTRWMSGQYDHEYRESWSAFRGRCVGALQRVLSDTDRARRAVVFTSGGPISAIAQELLGLSDALGALGPPNIPVTFGWPDRIEVNGGTVGGVRVAAAEVRGAADAIPDWMVLGVSVQVHGFPDDDSPGLRADRTALHEEGFGEVEAPALLESFSRHFLAWMNTWQDDGFDQVCAAWIARASDYDGEVSLTVSGEAEAETVTGMFTGIDGAGALLLGTEDGVRRVGLAAALMEPSWPV